MKARTLFFLFATLTILPDCDALAYNSQSCGEWTGRQSDKRGFPFGWMTSSSKLSTSSTQFASSWGHCRALGMQENRERFLADNLEVLSLEAAEGRGEHLEALAMLSGCRSPEARLRLERALQKSFPFLDPAGTANDAASVLRNLDRLIQSSPELKGSCEIDANDASLASRSIVMLR